MIQEKNSLSLSLSLSPCTPRRLANKPNPKVTNKQSNPDQNLNTTRSEPQLACPLCAHLIGTFGLPSCNAFGFSMTRARSSRLPPRGSTWLIAISHLATPSFLQLCMTSTPSQWPLWWMNIGVMSVLVTSDRRSGWAPMYVCSGWPLRWMAIVVDNSRGESPLQWMNVAMDEPSSWTAIAVRVVIENGHCVDGCRGKWLSRWITVAADEPRNDDRHRRAWADCCDG